MFFLEPVRGDGVTHRPDSAASQLLRVEPRRVAVVPVREAGRVTRKRLTGEAHSFPTAGSVVNSKPARQLGRPSSMCVPAN